MIGSLEDSGSVCVFCPKIALTFLIFYCFSSVPQRHYIRFLELEEQTNLAPLRHVKRKNKKFALLVFSFSFPFFFFFFFFCRLAKRPYISCKKNPRSIIRSPVNTANFFGLLVTVLTGFHYKQVSHSKQETISIIFTHPSINSPYA